MDAALTIGLLGTGRMGSSMARALARAGRTVILWNRTTRRAEELAAEIGSGARVACTPGEVAAEADVSLTMLADDPAVREVYEGPDGLLARAHARTVLIDLSTVPPDTIRSFEDRARATGAGILDAPVSGSVTTADAGELTLMVGGTAQDLERARPALEPLAKAIFHLGPLGSGAAMKLAVNGVIFGLSNAISEALVLAESAGIARTSAYDVIASSAAAAPLVQYKRQAFLDPDAAPTAFTLDLAAKDLGLIAGFADSLGLTAPQTHLNLELIRDAAHSVGGQRDFALVAEHLRRTKQTR